MVKILKQLFIIAAVWKNADADILTVDLIKYEVISLNKKLGFGFMRLPMTDGEVDVEKAKEMVDLFMEGGFDYFDTSWGYIDGKSESALKEALVDRYQESNFELGQKLASMACKLGNRSKGHV